jgi:hypothetical protein
LIVVRGAVGDLLEPGAVGMDAVDVGRAAALGGEDDPLAVGGEGGVVIETVGGKERALVAAIGVRQEEAGADRSEAAEDDSVLVAWDGLSGCRDEQRG